MKNRSIMDEIHHKDYFSRLHNYKVERSIKFTFHDLFHLFILYILRCITIHVSFFFISSLPTIPLFSEYNSTPRGSFGVTLQAYSWVSFHLHSTPVCISSRFRNSFRRTVEGQTLLQLWFRFPRSTSHHPL